MATAEEELERANRGEGCLGKAKPNEPVFVLRAQDNLAADLVELWAIRAGVSGVCSPDKIREAHELAEQMRDWPVQKSPD